MEELRDRRIALEVCPTSNVRLGIVDRVEGHPIRSLVDAGLVVTVGSDDPPMFNTSRTDELFALHRNLGFTIDEIEQLILNGVEASFLPLEAKESMTREFDEEFRRLRREHVTSETSDRPRACR